MRRADLSSWVLSQDLPGYDPDPAPSGGITIGGGNVPKASWGQHHRISGLPYYRNTRQHPASALRGIGDETTAQASTEWFTKANVGAAAVMALNAAQGGSVASGAGMAAILGYALGYGVKDITPPVLISAFIGNIVGATTSFGWGYYKIFGARRRKSKQRTTAA